MSEDLVQVGKKTSTAATTDFVSHRVDGPGGYHLWVDGNQKISGWDPRPNAFSLPEIASCPWRTPSCEKACYVHGLRKHRPDIAELYEHNSRTVREIIDSHAGNQVWSSHFGQWIAENCSQTGFRWHVSGDVFSDAYASWIRDVVVKSVSAATVAGLPEPRHWIYTRSFPYVGTLVRARPYLIVNLSADRDNYWLARRTADEHGLRVCYLTSDGTVPDDLREGDVVFPDYGLRERDLAPATARGESTWYQGLAPVARAGLCPVDFHGKSERRRCSPPGGGGCSKCTVPHG